MPVDICLCCSRSWPWCLFVSCSTSSSARESWAGWMTWCQSGRRRSWRMQHKRWSNNLNDQKPPLITIYVCHCSCYPGSVLDSLFYLFPQEEHSIIAEEEGIVQVPLEGHYKWGILIYDRTLYFGCPCFLLKPVCQTVSGNFLVLLQHMKGHSYKGVMALFGWLTVSFHLFLFSKFVKAPWSWCSMYFKVQNNWTWFVIRVWFFQKCGIREKQM